MTRPRTGRRPDGGDLALQRVLGDRCLAQADGRGLAEDRGPHDGGARGGTSTLSVWAGRPFFIRIGVSQASRAPASSRAVSTAGHTRGSRSSTLVSSTSRSSTPCRPTVGRVADQQPHDVGVALGVAAARADADRCGGHRRLRPPGVGEGREQRGAGGGAQLHRRRARRPGVRRHAAQQLGHRGRRHRQHAVGAADGAGPHRDRADHDLGRRRGRRSRRRHRRRRRSRRARRPRGSARPRVGAVDGGLGVGQPLEDASARARTASASGASSSSARTSRQERWWTESATSTWQRVAARPAAVHLSTRSATGSGVTASTAACSTSSGTPAPTRAPSSMSPLAPGRRRRPRRRHARSGRRRATRAAKTPAP